MNYTVSVGEDYKRVACVLSSVATSEIASGDIISNDKVAIPYCLNTIGGTAQIKEASIVIYDSAGLVQSAAIDIMVFNNLETATLGLSSNDTYVLDYTNNVATDVKEIAITSFAAQDDFTTIGHAKDVNMRITPKDVTQYGLSFALVARAAITLSATHTVTVIFDFIRN